MRKQVPVFSFFFSSSSVCSPFLFTLFLESKQTDQDLFVILFFLLSFSTWYWHCKVRSESSVKKNNFLSTSFHFYWIDWFSFNRFLFLYLNIARLFNLIVVHANDLPPGVSTKLIIFWLAFFKLLLEEYFYDCTLFRFEKKLI